MLGHDATEGGAMRDWYDNPPIEDILAEQAERLPNGPLGLLGAVVVRKDTELGEYAKVVKDYDGGNLGTMEMAHQMEVVRLRRMRSKPVVGP